MVITITADIGDVIGPVPRRLFGSLVEHMGRCVYTGLYEPDHPRADASGLRSDVLELARELGVTVVRYPGGNFVSSYRWEDGVGPVGERPTRLDPAWNAVETNEFGLHEFMAWVDAVGAEPMYAVNLGTRGIQEAADVLEYCNHPGGTTLSEQRRANGADAPFGIRLWCLGNEMDGHWQVGHKTASEYGRLAAETARLMRMIDPAVELVVAGSSAPNMPTFGEWERTVLTHTAALVDHISVHAYCQEHDGDAESYLASAVGLDRYLKTTAAVIDRTLADLGLDKTIGIAVDEWNAWDQRHWNEVEQPRLRSAPPITGGRVIEDTYTVTDAVVVGTLLNCLLRNTDRVTMANLAQLVNVIAPIRSEPGGPAWRQTTFHPFHLAARTARGVSLRTTVIGAPLHTSLHGPVDPVDAAITFDERTGRAAAFLANRATTAEAEVELSLRGASLEVEKAHSVMTPSGATRHAANTEHAQPVVPVPLTGVRTATSPDGTTLSVMLPALSWSAVEFRVTGASPRSSSLT